MRICGRRNTPCEQTNSISSSTKRSICNTSSSGNESNIDANPPPPPPSRGTKPRPLALCPPPPFAEPFRILVDLALYTLSVGGLALCPSSNRMASSWEAVPCLERGCDRLALAPWECSGELIVRVRVRSLWLPCGCGRYQCSVVVVELSGMNPACALCYPPVHVIVSD